MPNLSVDLIKNLYYKDKLSVPEISKELGISDSIIYKFMGKMELPRRTPVETNRILFEKKPKSFSLKRNLSREEEKLRIAGIMLYWGEGCKANPAKHSWTVDFANSDFKMVKLFLKFLRRICGIDEKRLRVLLYCYVNQNVGNLKQYWRKVTNIPLSQFIKPYIRKDFLPEKAGKMKYGLIHVRYSDKKLLLQIEKWTEEYLQKNI